jgi:hypothetical protein
MLIKNVFFRFILSTTVIIFSNIAYSSAQTWKPFDMKITSPASISIERNRLTIDEITWVFNKEYTIGQFASGDWWVLGPVTIDSINPPFDGENNGWEINPIVDGDQGFQSGCEGDGFNPSLVPPLPYTADPTNGVLSIVKTTATGNEVPCIKDAVVLTVVKDIPPGNGSTVFRPPYVGNKKPFYNVDDIKKELLPRYEPIQNMPTLNYIASRFSKLQMDHKKGALGRALRPLNNMDNYQADNTVDQNEAALRFMIEEPYQNKKQALINYLQFGIDKIYTVFLGQTWPDGGGHQPGHLIVLSFAATLLDIQEAKNILDTATFFHGTRWYYSNPNGITLFGQDGTEQAYWNYLMGLGGNRSNRDPYGYIDGGDASHLQYLAITAQPHKGEILSAILMPTLQDAWPKKEFIMMRQFVDRWVYHGTWTQPDPYAPFDGEVQNYGITYGSNVQGAIMGTGRFPENHGDEKNGGQHKSLFVNNMWNKYRSVAPNSDTISPIVSINYPFPGDTLNDTCRISITTYGIHGISTIILVVDNKESDPKFNKGVLKYNEYLTTLIMHSSCEISVKVKDTLGNIGQSNSVSVFHR